MYMYTYGPVRCTIFIFTNNDNDGYDIDHYVPLISAHFRAGESFLKHTTQRCHWQNSNEVGEHM